MLVVSGQQRQQQRGFSGADINSPADLPGQAGDGDLPGLAPRILKGEIRGRVVIDVRR